MSGEALALHTTGMKQIIRLHGRTVKLTAPDGTEYDNLICLWNDVEHVLKLDNFSNEPMGDRDSIFIDRDSLNEAGITIMPGEQWAVTGSPNDYVVSATYPVQIPKQDHQLPGILMFLSKYDEDAKAWTKPAE